MNKPLAIGVGLLLLAALLLFSTTYTVKYNEVAVRATFGQADDESIVRDAGLHYRLPVFIDDIEKLDTRLQVVESALEEIQTSDELQVVVRAFLLWRVEDEGSGPLNFFESYETVDNANQLLPGQFRTAFTGVLSEYSFADLVGEQTRLAEAEEEIRSELDRALAGRGVRPEAVGISQLVLPPKTSSAVQKRMEATRNVLASEETARGKAEADRIRSEANTVAERIRAFAEGRAAEIRAEGEVQAAEYLKQMSEGDEELAIFLVWLDALERILNRQTTVILDTTSEPFHLLDPANMASGGIPDPGRVAGADEDGESMALKEQGE
jgi:membrane protease subunit HflC